jgi:hypothetical protein
MATWLIISTMADMDIERDSVIELNAPVNRVSYGDDFHDEE